VSDVRDQQKAIAIGGITQTLPLALSTVRETDSIVRAKNGQVVVIGGLMQNSDREQDAKTPGLGDLPAVGALFRHKRNESIKSELVILLRPIVIEGDQQWADAFRETGTHYQRLGDELEQWKDRRNSGLGYGKPDP
jgi:MSHA biogenesis protein MshL